VRPFANDFPKRPSDEEGLTFGTAPGWLCLSKVNHKRSFEPVLDGPKMSELQMHTLLAVVLK
jgi:hypothetical protein